MVNCLDCVNFHKRRVKAWDTWFNREIEIDEYSCFAKVRKGVNAVVRKLEREKCVDYFNTSLSLFGDDYSLTTSRKTPVRLDTYV